MTNVEEEKELIALVDRINRTLQNKWQSEHDHIEDCYMKEREMTELIRQTEIDLDEEIEQKKRFYNEQLRKLNEYFQHLTIIVSALRKQYNGILQRIESRDHQRALVEKEVKDLEVRRVSLINQLEQFQIRPFENCLKVHFHVCFQ